MEYWSNGKRTRIFFPILQYSITPKLLIRDSRELLAILKNYLFGNKGANYVVLRVDLRCVAGLRLRYYQRDVDGNRRNAGRRKG